MFGPLGNREQGGVDRVNRNDLTFKVKSGGSLGMLQSVDLPMFACFILGTKDFLTPKLSSSQHECVFILFTLSEEEQAQVQWDCSHGLGTHYELRVLSDTWTILENTVVCASGTSESTHE